jgi:hypothetical protein
MNTIDVEQLEDPGFDDAEDQDGMAAELAAEEEAERETAESEPELSEVSGLDEGKRGAHPGGNPGAATNRGSSPHPSTPKPNPYGNQPPPDGRGAAPGGGGKGRRPRRGGSGGSGRGGISLINIGTVNLPGSHLGSGNRFGGGSRVTAGVVLPSGRPHSTVRRRTI